MKKLLGKKKLLLAAPILILVVLAAVYKLELAPKPKPVVKKVNGTLVSLGDPFTVNLAGGHYGRVSVSLLLSAAPPAPPASEPTPPPIPQDDIVRSVITDKLTGIDPSRLIDRDARHALLGQLLRDLKKSTDEPVTKVLITDLAVQ